MAKYTRMIVMSMSDEEITEVLKKEGDSLPDYTVYMMIEELKHRKEAAEKLSEEQAEGPLESFSEQDTEDLEEEGLAEENFDFEELSEEGGEEILDDEARAEKEQMALEAEKASRKKTLLLALSATGATALAIVLFVIYLAVSGQL